MDRERYMYIYIYMQRQWCCHQRESEVQIGDNLFNKTRLASQLLIIKHSLQCLDQLLCSIRNWHHLLTYDSPNHPINTHCPCQTCGSSDQEAEHLISADNQKKRAFLVCFPIPAEPQTSTSSSSTLGSTTKGCTSGTGVSASSSLRENMGKIKESPLPNRTLFGGGERGVIGQKRWCHTPHCKG